MSIARLILTSLVISFMSAPAFAALHELDVEMSEAERAYRVKNTTDMTEAMDLMNPDELAKEIGIDDDGSAEFGESFEDLYTPIARRQYLVNIYVSIGNQALTIQTPEGEWSTVVSTGKAPKKTRRGCYGVARMHRKWFSKKYDNSPMPNSIFYSGPYAIHGTNYERYLGRPASKGCVRVSKADAKAIYDTVQYYGPGNTRICVN